MVKLNYGCHCERSDVSCTILYGFYGSDDRLMLLIHTRVLHQLIMSIVSETGSQDGDV